MSLFKAQHVMRAFSHDYREAVLKHFRTVVECVDFDSIVVSGASGLLMGTFLAHATHKGLVLVRKPGDGSHSNMMVEGSTKGGRLLWVDDFVRTAETAKRVNATLTEYWYDWRWTSAFLYMHHPYDYRDWTNKSWLDAVPVYAFYGRLCDQTGEVSRIDSCAWHPEKERCS